MTTMDSPLPAPAAEAADSQPATDGPMGLAAVPGSALADLCNSLTECKTRYDGYRLQSERGGNLGWAARYGDIADAYEHCIARIEALMSKPNAKSAGADASEKNAMNTHSTPTLAAVAPATTCSAVVDALIEVLPQHALACVSRLNIQEAPWAFDVDDNGKPLVTLESCQCSGKSMRCLRGLLPNGHPKGFTQNVQADLPATVGSASGNDVIAG